MEINEVNQISRGSLTETPTSTDELYAILMDHTHCTGQRPGSGTMSFNITHYTGTGNHYVFPVTFNRHWSLDPITVSLCSHALLILAKSSNSI